MTPLPFALGNDASLVAWRIDARKHAATWDSGQGSYLGGGRWNSPGRYIVYCSFDPAATILEVAAHKTFKALDTVPHVLTSLEVSPAALSDVFVVKPDHLCIVLMRQWRMFLGCQVNSSQCDVDQHYLRVA